MKGGKSAAIDLLRGSEIPDVRRFLEVYDDAPAASRARLPIEAFSIAANLPTSRLVGIVVEEAVRQGALCATLIAASYLHRVIKKTAEMALTCAGVQDRKMFLQATGFLPAPEGSTNILSVFQFAERRGASRPMVLLPVEAKERQGATWSAARHAAATAG